MLSKSRTFKFVYLQNNLYHQKVHKKLHIRHYHGYPGFQAVFELLVLQNGKKSKNGANFLGTSLKIRFQTLTTQQKLKKSK